MIDQNNIDFNKLKGFDAYPTAEEVENFPTIKYTVWDRLKQAIRKLLPPENIKRGRSWHMYPGINLNGPPQFYEDGAKVKTKDLFNIY